MKRLDGNSSLGRRIMRAVDGRRELSDKAIARREGVSVTAMRKFVARIRKQRGGCLKD